MGIELGIKQVSFQIFFFPQFAAFQLADWYGVSKYDVSQRGGQGLWYYYASLAELLRAVYPEHEWDMQRFPAESPLPRRSRGYWQQPSNVREFLESVSEPLGVKEVPQQQALPSL